MTALLRIPQADGLKDKATRDYFNEVNRINEKNFNSLNNQLNKSTLTGTVTLTTNVASTTIANTFIKANSLIFMMPTTANAAAEVASGNLYYTVAAGSIVINHTNSATAGRTFSYVIFIY
jgi:hypothetical protein